VYGNPLGCVQVPDSVSSLDTTAQGFWHDHDEGVDKTARCGDNCTALTVYVPSDGVCVQCPDGMRALGVGALACSVLLSERCFLRPRAFVYFCVRMCISVYLDASVYLCVCRWCGEVLGCVAYEVLYYAAHLLILCRVERRVAHEVLACGTHLLQCARVCVCVRICVYVCVSSVVYLDI